MRIESSIGQLLFGTPTVLVEELFRIKISTEELLFPIRYFGPTSIFPERYILEKVNFSEKHSAFPTFPRGLPFSSGYFFKPPYLLWQLSSEAVALRCSLKKVFLEISQNLQENACDRVVFLIKLPTSGLQFMKKRDSFTGSFLRILLNFKEHFFL